MDYGLALPNFPDGASTEGIEAAAEVAQRLGWSTVWTTDHVLVPNDAREDYGRIYDAILTLAWVGAKYPRIRLGTSVIVIPMRNPVVVAKQLATWRCTSGRPTRVRSSRSQSGSIARSRRSSEVPASELARPTIPAYQPPARAPSRSVSRRFSR